MNQSTNSPLRDDAPSTTPPLRAELPLDLAAFVTPAAVMSPGYVGSATAAEQIPFIFWLIDATLPSTIVDVGAADATVYFGLCQGAEALSLDTRCYLGATALKQDEERAITTTRAWIEHQNTHHGLRSQIVGGGTNELKEVLQEKSVDLLVLHAASSSLEQLRQWKTDFLPLLSPRSVIYVDGLGEDPHAFFDDLASEKRAFRFHHGTGFGVVAGGSSPPKLLRYLVDLGESKEDAGLVRTLFHRVGIGCRYDLDQRSHRGLRRRFHSLTEELHQAREEVAAAVSRVVAHEAGISELRDRLGWHRGQLDRARQECSNLQAEARGVRSALDQAQAMLDEANRLHAAEKAGIQTLHERTERTCRQLEGNLARLAEAGKHQEQIAAAALDEVRALRAELDMLYSSRSWRITAPLRWIMTRLRR